jgi:hypothetical protein
MRCAICQEEILGTPYITGKAGAVHCECYRGRSERWTAVDMLFPVHTPQSGCSDEDVNTGDGCMRCLCLTYQAQVGIDMFPKV